MRGDQFDPGVRERQSSARGKVRGIGRGGPRVSRERTYRDGEVTWRPSMAMAPWMLDTHVLGLLCEQRGGGKADGGL